MHGCVCEFSGLFTAGVVGLPPIPRLDTSQGLEEKSMEARRGSESSLSSLPAWLYW